MEKYGFERIRAAGFNGAVCYDQGRLVAARPLKKELICALITMIRQEFPSCEILQVQGLNSDRIFTSLDHPVVERYRRDIAKIGIGRVMDFTIDDFLQQPMETQAGKLSITMASHEAALVVMERIRDLASEQCFITMSGDRLVEVANRTASKGVFVQYLKQAYGLKSEEVAVIGDALNDAEMFPEASHTFAMQSGSEEAKRLAKHLVMDVAECIDWCLEYNQRQEGTF